MPLAASRSSIGSGNPRIKKELLWVLLVGVLGWIVTGLYFDRGLDVFDAGLFATEAERITEGGVYGRDFLAPYGPGRYYLIALLFKTFGFSLEVQAALWLVLRGLIGMLVYRIGRGFLPRWLALLPAVAVLFAPGALHKSFFQTAALLNILFYLRYRAQPDRLRLGIAGLAVGAGALFRVDVGVFGALSFLVLLWLEPLWDRPRPSVREVLKRNLAFLAGAASATLPVFLYFLARGGLGMVFMAEWHRTGTVSGFAEWLHVPGIGEALEGGLSMGAKGFLLGLMIRTAPVVYILLLITATTRRFCGNLREGGLEVLSLALFGFPLLNQVRITPTFNHLLHAIPLVLISAVLLVRLLATSRLLDRLHRPPLIGLLAGMLCFLFCGLPVFYNLAFTRGVLPGSILNRHEFTEPIALDRAGVFETPKTAGKIEKIVRYIQSTTSPGDCIFAPPFSPVLHFLADRPPAVRFLEPFYYFGSKTLQEQVVEDLEGHRPTLIILEPSSRVGRSSLEADAPLVNAFIRQNYRPTGPAGVGEHRYEIWLRRD